jgi:hypothetical protein
MIRRYAHNVLQVASVGQDITEEELLKQPNGETAAVETPGSPEIMGDFEKA